MLKNKHYIDKSHRNTGKNLEKHAGEESKKRTEATLQRSTKRFHCDHLAKECAEKRTDEDPDRHKEKSDDRPHETSERSPSRAIELLRPDCGNNLIGDRHRGDH